MTPRLPSRRLRDAAAILAIALAAAALFTSPALERGRGLSLDILTWLRFEAFGNAHPATDSPAVVIAIDEESYQAPPFKGAPLLTWTGEIGRVLGAVIDGGAKVVGFDVVFPTSIEQSEIPFADTTLGEKVRGFDREFLIALRKAASADKVVLGEAFGEPPVIPSPGQRVAVRQQQNLRPLNTYTDRDDVVRRQQLMFTVDNQAVPAMALELAARASGAKPTVGADGAVMLGDYAIPGRVPNTMTLNFAGGAQDIPTTSFADLRACAIKGDRDYFAREFKDKVVLIGTVLALEDRRLTAKRFATRAEGARRPRCALPEAEPRAQAKPTSFTRSTIAGVYIHATAVNNLIRRDAAIEPGLAWGFALSALFALISATLARLIKPLPGAVLAAILATLYAVIATLLFRISLALPLVEPLGAGALAFAATIAHSFVVSDKDKRLLQKSFGYYLAPGLVARMLASGKLPELGGETREVTVFFSDIEGFSKIAETLSPHDLMALTNAYLSAMTDVIEQHGGYVDKYIGDSVVAVFGAPIDDADHAKSAARAALACKAKLTELNATSAEFRDHKLRQRIGINSGEALVGNFGSERRFNYSVMSDAVNVASRLEGANKFYATTIIASQATVVRAGDGFIWRELDTIRVKGRDTQLRIHELCGSAEEATPAMSATLKAYAEGLAHWRNGDAPAAAAAFARNGDDSPSAMFLARTRAETWDPVRTLQEK